MSDNKYYDGTKLLSMMDINGKKPELYLCTTNRSAGKTTYFGRLLVNNFLKRKEKFCLIYRFNYELDNVAEKFFKDIGTLFFPDHVLTADGSRNTGYYTLYLDGEPCGYAVTLNNADVIKRYSHIFSDVERMLFDEFQSESNHYCTNEVQKFISLHTTIARGRGKMVRRVPVYMIGNTVSIINPYFVELGISERLEERTRFIRGDGYVLEQGFNEGASEAQMESGFNRAFASNKYVAYASQNVYLNDNKAFIEKMTGPNRYLVTLKYEGAEYAIREYENQGVVYCDTNVDTTYPVRIAVTTDDHQINYVMLSRSDIILQNLRFFFDKGAFRFKNLRCKEAVLTALSYKMK